MKLTILKIVTIIALLSVAAIVCSTDNKSEFPSVPLAERTRIWDALAGKGNYSISGNQLEATFEIERVKWTIIGANAPIVTPTNIPKQWPIKGNTFKILVVPEPITDYMILPFTEHIENGVSSGNISIAGAPDTHEPASFVIRSGDVDVENVMIQVSDLTNENKKRGIKTTVFPKSNVDVRVVKCWYQAGVGLGDLRHKLLVPELLLHDDNLVRVDYDKQVNIIKHVENIQDADQLQSFNVPRRQNKQIWLTIKIPANTAPGVYNGIITVSSSNKSVTNLKLRLEILPIKLSPPYYTSSIYYRGTLDPQDKGTISSELKSEKQFRAELTNMYAHGVTNPTVYQSFNKTQLGKVLKIRNEVGMGKQPLYYLGVTTGNPNDPGKLELLTKTVKDVIGFSRDYGIPDVYFYGKDQAIGEELKSQEAAWKAVHAGGGKVFVAGISKNNITHMGHLQDLLIFNGIPSKAEAEKWHNKQHKIWSYANPQGGEEKPETYRRNYGLVLWNNSYDGACTYAYQHSFGSIWNDFDEFRLRDHAFTYPTTNGVVDTVQWEGYRAAVNDIRYVTTLADFISLKNNGKITYVGNSDVVTGVINRNLELKGKNLYVIRDSIVGYLLGNQIK